MIRLHIPAIPYTITRDEYSHDAFTNKVKLFSPMMRSIGFEVYHYGVETSVSNATKQIDIMTKEEWTDLRIKTWQFVDKSLTYEAAVKKNNDPSELISQISNWSSPLTKEFNVRFRKHLMENYRSNTTDLVCIPLSRTYQDALDKLNYVVIEVGIGYSGSYLNYRIFESYSWMSNTLGKENKQPNNYWFVIPHAFDTNEFKLSLTPEPRRVGFLGRITNLKGCGIIKEIARRFPSLQFILCGQGDYKEYIDLPNIVYKPPIHGTERSEYLGGCVAFLHLAKYLEPFGCGPVEAQLCGTPVICSDWGGMVETVEQGTTGLRGHTLADYCYGIQMALDGKFDRQYIRDRAVRLYDMYNVAKQYNYVFRTILDIHTPGKNGWYSPDTHIKPLLEEYISKKKQRIYLTIPYYGAFPNYFQLYLDSLGINTDILTVFLITDIDMKPYTCPENLIVIKMNKYEVKKRASKFILETYNKVIEPDNLLKDNYKLVDFKIVFSLIFDDILQNHGVTEEDYVGWGDIDLIYGKLSNFIDFKEGYGILGGWHGHFTAIKNTDSFKNNFKAIPNYLELITDNSKTYVTDEIAYREPLKKYLSENKIKMFYANAYFCDIVPPCFYHMSRPDHKSWTKNFYDVYNPNKNINYLYYDKSSFNLSVIYDTGERRHVLYCHLQKRKMELPFTSYDKGYYINENSFSLANITECNNLNNGRLDIDMVYYINLDKRRDRNEHVMDQLKKAGVPDNKITRYTAIDGDTYRFSDEELDLFKKADFMHTPSSKKMMGNQLSHFSIFKDMLKNNFDKVLILQDDVVLRENFIEQLNNVSNTMPSNCEIVNVGMHEYCYFNVFKAYDLTADDDYKRVEKEKINEYISIWKNNIQPCSLSYIITNEGSKNMIKYFEENGFPCGTDIAFNRYLQAKNIFYGSRTVLCTGDPSFGTDIFNTEAWWEKPK
jgi:GR25 family glycosyltransferase involved in LPS biosynthesis